MHPKGLSLNTNLKQIIMYGVRRKGRVMRSLPRKWGNVRMACFTRRSYPRSFATNWLKVRALPSPLPLVMNCAEDVGWMRFVEACFQVNSIIATQRRHFHIRSMSACGREIQQHTLHCGYGDQRLPTVGLIVSLPTCPFPRCYLLGD